MPLREAGVSGDDLSPRASLPRVPNRGPGLKFLVNVFDETGETVAIATILTMVKKLDQN